MEIYNAFLLSILCYFVVLIDNYILILLFSTETMCYAIKNLWKICHLKGIGYIGSIFKGNEVSSEINGICADLN